MTQTVYSTLKNGLNSLCYSAAGFISTETSSGASEGLKACRPEWEFFYLESSQTAALPGVFMHLRAPRLGGSLLP